MEDRDAYKRGELAAYQEALRFITDYSRRGVPPREAMSACRERLIKRANALAADLAGKGGPVGRE